MATLEKIADDVGVVPIAVILEAQTVVLMEKSQRLEALIESQSARLAALSRRHAQYSKVLLTAHTEKGPHG